MAEQQRTATDRGQRAARGSGGGAGSGRPVFVVQRHAATTLHYDFRLEVEGVLKSWAVPKGPSTDPGEKRLATPTEDHPLGYADFEGTLPEGYGAGSVVVWDTGAYRNITAHEGETVEMAEALASGHVKIWLEGSKLRGGYALTRSQLRGQEQWLLVKVADEQADREADVVTQRPESVLTGRTNAELDDAGDD